MKKFASLWFTSPVSGFNALANQCMAQFMALQTGNVAWLWAEGHVFGFKVSSPVSLSALITFRISMLARPPHTVHAFWPLFTLVWLQLTEIYLMHEKRRHTQPNLISVIKDKSGNGLIPYSPVIGSAVWEFADRYSNHPETDIAIATTLYLYNSLICPNNLNRMTSFT